MLTQEDFKAVAEIIEEQVDFAKVFSGQSFALRSYRVIAENLADYFATQNPRFDRERFMKVCGLD